MRSTAIPVVLAGSSRDSGRLKFCSRCDLDKPAAGGCELAPNRWVCSECWKSAKALRKAANGCMR